MKKIMMLLGFLSLASQVMAAEAAPKTDAELDVFSRGASSAANTFVYKGNTFAGGGTVIFKQLTEEMDAKRKHSQGLIDLEAEKTYTVGHGKTQVFLIPDVAFFGFESPVFKNVLIQSDLTLNFVKPTFLNVTYSGEVTINGSELATGTFIADPVKLKNLTCLAAIFKPESH